VGCTGQTVLCNDVHEDPRNHAVEWFETAAELAVPVVVKDKTVAVINVEAWSRTSLTRAMLRPWKPWPTNC
jgi:putative methionine-R-sulfoxide reductase with GAF domain